MDVLQKSQCGDNEGRLCPDPLPSHVHLLTGDIWGRAASGRAAGEEVCEDNGIQTREERGAAHPLSVSIRTDVDLSIESPVVTVSLTVSVDMTIPTRQSEL